MPPFLSDAMNYELARHHMIQQQLRTSEVLSPEVVEQLYADRREHYVPEPYHALAFADVSIPLDPAKPAAVMLTPKLEAHILQDSRLRPNDRVLVVGAGSGHLAALLGEEAQKVWAIEIDPLLAERARDNLANDGVVNVSIEVGDGLQGYAAHAPFDFILIAGGVAEIPAVLLSQLKPGGRLLAFVGRTAPQVLRKVTRQSEDVFVSEDSLETMVPQLLQANPPEGFHF
jgi:protein-L-isoaspartate(D-aspartate) O-methyltransferase